MLNHLLSENQLRNLKLEQFKKEYDQGVKMTFTTDFSFDCLEEDEDFELLYDDAEVFCKGSCQLFALALQRRFNYKTYKLENNGTHWFCKAPVRKNNIYIDIRGICDNIEIFTSTLYLSATTIDSSIEYDIEQEVPTREIDKLGLAFAEWIIQKWENRYKV